MGKRKRNGGGGGSCEKGRGNRQKKGPKELENGLLGRGHISKDILLERGGGGRASGGKGLLEGLRKGFFRGHAKRLQKEKGLESL